MEKIGWQLVHEIAEEQLPTRNRALFEKLQQHGVGGHAGKKSSGEGGRAAVPDITEAKQRGRHNGQTPGPAGGFDRLSHNEPQGNEHEQAGQRAKQAVGQPLGGKRSQVQPPPADQQKGDGH